MSWQHIEIHTNCIYDFKPITILLSFLPQLPSPSEEKDNLVIADEDLGHLVCFSKVFIGRLLYARHCGIPNYTFSLTIKNKRCFKNKGWYSEKSTTWCMALLASETTTWFYSLEGPQKKRLSGNPKTISDDLKDCSIKVLWLFQDDPSKWIVVDKWKITASRHQVAPNMLHHLPQYLSLCRAVALSEAPIVPLQKPVCRAWGALP